MSNWGTCLNIGSGPVTVKHQLNYLCEVFRKYRSDKVSALGEINNVRGRVLKSELDSYRENEQQYSLGVVLQQETGQVSKKLS